LFCCCGGVIRWIVDGFCSGNEWLAGRGKGNFVVAAAILTLSERGSINYTTNQPPNFFVRDPIGKIPVACVYGGALSKNFDSGGALSKSSHHNFSTSLLTAD
jgi:hypothetical protein